MTTAPINLPLATAPTAIIPRLSLMMFLQFAIQGAWLPLLFPFFNESAARHFSEGQVAALFTAAALGAIASPFIAGQLADRYMNAERFMAVAHVVGAVFVWLFAYVTSYYVLIGLAFFYATLYTPTLAAANAIAFTHLPDRDRDFGKVRVWGTIGWVVVGIAIGQWLFRWAGEDRTAQVEAMGDAFRLAAILGVAQGLYALTLPKTPPKREAQSYAPGKALAEIRRQPLITIFLLSIPIAAVHQFFFVRTSQFLGQKNLDAPLVQKIFGVGGAGVMTIGQISELVVLALMPLVVKRVPRKTILAVGLCAYFLRFIAFAYLPYAWALLPALALHGLVFGCFFFVCFMLVDEHTTRDVRASAQNMFNLVVFGLGVIVGNILVGVLSAWTSYPVYVPPVPLAGWPVLPEQVKFTNWPAYYSIPAWITLACLVALLIFYPSAKRARETAVLEPAR